MDLPDNKTHQEILQTLMNLFSRDSNVLAFGVFGSLGRRDFDNYSDLDLDTKVKDVTRKMVSKEVNKMLLALKRNGFKTLLNFEEIANEWVVIFDSLDRIGTKFHSRLDANPKILDSLIILYGQLAPKPF